MNTSKGLFTYVALLTAALASSARAQPAPILPTGARYATRCALVDSSRVEGFVINLGPVPIQLSGAVRFVFSATSPIAHPTIQTQSGALIAPGTTVSVARAQLISEPLPGDTCRLDVHAAIRP